MTKNLKKRKNFAAAMTSFKTIPSIPLLWELSTCSLAIR